jgi:CheY-like chemotaxis protein
MANTPTHSISSHEPVFPRQISDKSNTTARRQILVVENDAAIRTMLVDLLEDEGYAVIPVADGKRALETLREQRPTVVILDLMLPVMSGWEFLSEARDLLARLKVPVVVVSAIDGRSDYPSLLGVTAWFAKPLNIPRFLRTLQQLT